MPPYPGTNMKRGASSEHPWGINPSKTYADNESDEEPTKQETIRESVRRVIRSATDQPDGSPDHKLKIKPLYREVEKRRLGRKLPWSSKEANIRHLLSVHAEFIHDENHYWTLTAEGWAGNYFPRKESQEMNRKARAQEEERRSEVGDRKFRATTQRRGSQERPMVPMPSRAVTTNSTTTDPERYPHNGYPRNLDLHNSPTHYHRYGYTPGYSDQHHAAQYSRPTAPYLYNHASPTSSVSLSYPLYQTIPPPQHTNPQHQTQAWHAQNNQDFMDDANSFQEQHYYQSQNHDHFDAYWGE